MSVSQFIYGHLNDKPVNAFVIENADGIKDVLMSQFIMENSKKVVNSNEDSNSIYSLFENEFGRALTPFEIDTIRDWIESGFSIDLVKSALNEAVRNKVRSIKYVDRVLLNYRQQEEIKKEGNTTISEKWRKDIDETMNIAKTRWVKEND
jgi:DNA replication protein